MFESVEQKGANTTPILILSMIHRVRTMMYNCYRSEKERWQSSRTMMAMNNCVVFASSSRGSTFSIADNDVLQSHPFSNEHRPETKPRISTVAMQRSVRQDKELL